MKGITYFKLKSPYVGDLTKNCALDGIEVDNNFLTLEDRDIKSIEVIDDKVVVNLMDGTQLTTTNEITKGCVKGLSISFDEKLGVLTIEQNGIKQAITGFATKENIGDTVAVGETLIGNGEKTEPIEISPIARTGQYRPVKEIIKITNGEKLPTGKNVLPGDRYLTEESVNNFGYLYNYEGLKRIACLLQENKSEWRIPTKEDWDIMLDAIEPNKDYRDHSDARSNKFLGKYAGRFLKSPNYWKNGASSVADGCGCCTEDVCIDYSVCGDDCCSSGDKCCVSSNSNVCKPNYCGETSCKCNTQDCDNHSGIDKYGFNAVPAGCANGAKDYTYFRERAYFWTATNKEYRDAFIKVLDYDHSNVLQDIMASDNYFSIRLVKDYNGSNYNEREDILGASYSTVLMPTTKGSAIWTSVNIALEDCGCGCKHILPNDGNGMDYTTKFFTNEWTGSMWLRKELSDGESVVVIRDKKDDGTGNKNKDYTEYRATNGALIDVSRMVYVQVVDKYDKIVNDIKKTLCDEINRSTTKDAEHDGRIKTNEESIAKNANDIKGFNSRADAIIDRLNEETQTREANDTELLEKIDEESRVRAEKDTDLEDKLTGEATTREAKDTELQEKIDEEARVRAEKDTELGTKVDELQTKLDTEKTEREAKDVELAGKQLTQEGTEFNSESGILTLKSVNGTNDVSVQFNFNFGEFGE